MGKKKHHSEEHENHERWLVSYADMITLLMVFFIILYASSQLNVSKYKALQESAAEALGTAVKEVPNPTEAPTPVPTPTPSATKNPGSPEPSASASPDKPTPSSSEASPEPTVLTAEQLDELYRQVKHKIEKAGIAEEVDLYTDARGVILVFTDQVLFGSARAEVLPSGKRLLTRLAPVLQAQANPVIVEGHTDNLPLRSGPFATNWELSTTRATNVLRYLVEHEHLPAKKMSAAGYANTHPRVANTTAKARAKNRRVEIVIVAPPSSRRAAPALPNPAKH